MLKLASEHIEKIYNTVSTCFGPEGRFKADLSPSGKIILCCSVQQALQRIQPKHPLARLVKDNALAHCCSNGNGTGAFIIIITEILRQLSLLNISQRKILKHINEINNEIIENQIFPKIDEISEEYKLQDEMKNLIFTNLITCTSKTLSEMFSEMIKEILTPKINQETLFQRIEFVWRNFHRLIYCAPNASVSDSQIFKGFMLDACLASRYMSKQCSSPCQAVIVSSEIFQTIPEMVKTEYYIDSTNSAQKYFHHSHRISKLILNSALEKKISLIFVKGKASEQFIMQAINMSIIVIHGLSFEDTEFFACQNYTKIIENINQLNNLNSQSFIVNDFSEITLSSAQKSIFVESEYSQNQFLLIRAPTQEMAQDYNQFIKQSIRMLLKVFESRDSVHLLPACASAETNIGIQFEKLALKTNDVIAKEILLILSNSFLIVPKHVLNSVDGSIQDFQEFKEQTKRSPKKGIYCLIQKDSDDDPFSSSISSNMNLFEFTHSHGLLETSVSKKELTKNVMATLKQILKLDSIIPTSFDLPILQDNKMS
eukprot:gb/GECH01009642.1/.p1 GENE.gb/GECH01009642.1/~~gb/GECH01009642.1/.p1  ORF type:complete len:542 (+),score=140.91 gb/GECH01009642.1/:1-1626(+)